MVFEEGVVLASEKKIQSKLLVPTSIQKIHELDFHCACAVSGLAADSKNLIQKARVTAAHHSFLYQEKISIHAVTQAVSDLALEFGNRDP